MSSSVEAQEAPTPTPTPDSSSPFAVTYDVARYRRRIIRRTGLANALPRVVIVHLPIGAYEVLTRANAALEREGAVARSVAARIIETITYVRLGGTFRRQLNAVHPRHHDANPHHSTWRVRSCAVVLDVPTLAWTALRASPEEAGYYLGFVVAVALGAEIRARYVAPLKPTPPPRPKWRRPLRSRAHNADNPCAAGCVICRRPMVAPGEIIPSCDQLRAERLRLGISQRELARWGNISRGLVAAVELKTHRAPVSRKAVWLGIKAYRQAAEVKSCP